MTAMEDLCANSSNCREITVKLCWPHLEEEAEVVAVPFDVEQAASEINDYLAGSIKEYPDRFGGFAYADVAINNL